VVGQQSPFKPNLLHPVLAVHLVDTYLQQSNVTPSFEGQQLPVNFNAAHAGFTEHLRLSGPPVRNTR
jgi:hypothetical protein